MKEFFISYRIWCRNEIFKSFSAVLLANFFFKFLQSINFSLDNVVYLGQDVIIKYIKKVTKKLLIINRCLTQVNSESILTNKWSGELAN